MRHLLLLLAPILFLFSCNNAATTDTSATNSSKTATASLAAATPQSKLNNTSTSKLMTTVGDYYALKDAMIAANAGKADESGKKLATSADDLKTALVSDSASGAMLVPYLDTIKTELND